MSQRIYVDDAVVDEELAIALAEDERSGVRESGKTGRWYARQDFGIDDYYEGGWTNDGLFDGYGELHLPKGYGYTGTWRSGKYHKSGHLKLCKEDKTVLLYHGGFRDGEFHGKGILNLKNSNNDFYEDYDGSFFEGKFEGQGVYVKTEKGNTTKYSGSFLKSKFNGKGHLVLPDGTEYIGMFKDGRKHGKGVLDTKAFKYRGQFFMDAFHTTGGSESEMSWSAPSQEMCVSYVGEYRHGCCHGHGVCRYTDGSVYRGAWKYNKWNGMGKLLNKTNTIVYEGEFSDGLYDGKGKLYRPDGSVEYEGEFLMNEKHGMGKAFRRDGSLRYTGTFTRNEITGIGMLYNRSGSFYNGEVAKEKPHGFGEFTDIFKGTWKGWFKLGQRFRAWVPPLPPKAGSTKITLNCPTTPSNAAPPRGNDGHLPSFSEITVPRPTTADVAFVQTTDRLKSSAYHLPALNTEWYSRPTSSMRWHSRAK
jgi:hypothetical protein